MKRFLNISSKTILYILIFLSCLGAITYYALQWAEVQTAITQRATKWLSEKLGSNVSIGSVKFSWFDELTLEDVIVKDLDDRDMFYLREVYINMKSNFDFNKEDIIRFDNNLDFVLLKDPDVKLIREDNGELNVDRWIAKLVTLNKNKKPKGQKDNNVPFTIDEAVIQNGSFEMIDPREKRFSPELFDYYNFKIDKINGKLKEFFIQGDTIIFNGSNIKGVEKRSNLVINHINTDFFYSRDQMLLSNLDASINNSQVGDFLGFYYDSPKDFSDFNNKIRMRANLVSCELDAQDLGRFATDMYNYKERYVLTADLSGTVKNLLLRNTELKFGTGSALLGKMQFKGLPNIYDTIYEFELQPSLIVSKDAEQYAGKKYFDLYVKKFGDVTLNGIFQGSYDNFYTDARISATKMGDINGKLKFYLDKKTKKPVYNGDVKIDQLNLAELTNNQNLLQKISFKGQIAGEGTTLGDAAVKLNGKVASVYFNGYDFKNIDVNGVLVKSKFDGYIKIDDANLNTQITGKIDFNKAQNEFHIIGILERANLKALGYLDKDYTLQTNFNLDFDGNDLDNWLGSAKFNNMYIKGGERNLVVDQIRFSSRLIDDQRVLGIQSEFLDGSISGPFLPSTLAKDLSTLIKEYSLFFEGTETERLTYYKKKKVEDTLRTYQADYNVNFKNSDNLFAFLMPELYISPGSSIKGKFKQSNTSLFSSYALFDTIRYDGNLLINSELDFYSSKKSFAPEVLTSLVAFSDQQQFANEVDTENFEFNGSWGDTKEINFDSFIRQKDTKNTAQVFGMLRFLDDGFDLKINPRNSKLHLLDSDWIFDKDNLVNFKGQDVCFDQFEIRNENQSIALNGNISKRENEFLTINIEDFDLRTLEPIADLNLRGTANGEASISGIYDNPQIISNLYVNEMIYKGVLVGNLATEIKWDKAIQKMAIASNINRINQEIFRVNGTYDPKDNENALNLKANLRRTDMEILGTFVEDIFSGIRGYADGELLVTGMPLDPTIRGRVAVSQGQMRLKATGTQVFFDDDILFNEEGFVADEDGFEVRDARVNGNKATIKGGIFNGGAGNFMLGLHAYIQNKNGFRLLDLKNADSDVFYGSAYAIGDLHLTGPFDNVLVTGNLTSKPNTKISIPLDAATSVDVSEEAIPFAPMKPKGLAEELLSQDNKKETTSTSKKVSTAGLRMLFNLRLTPDAECEIIFDRQNNDKLNAFGNGRLTIEYDTRGTFTMSGPYVVTSGKYDFSFQNLASLRKFEILEGSRITWTGDPYNALLDVKAAYSTTFSLGDVPGISLEDATEGNNRFPMSVVIEIRGELENTDLAYNLNFDQSELPIRYQTQILAFEQRLRNDEQALSRNVSSILALNQFFPEGGGADVFNQQFLIDNLSSMLSNQIGNLANKLDPNLELGVLIGDFQQNLMNNLQLNFSYKFLNNRIKLSGKSSFSNTSAFLDNANTANTLNQGLLTVGGEVEWLLSEDGTWKLKGYSRSVPNVTLTNASANGNVVVSGINVIFSRNFNSIFSAPKKDNEKAPNKFPIGVGRKEENPELSLNKK
ncbi:Family of unknown function [Spirosomataceae bacterium TFI 002]|nr:Family of unknown function [Spirosomataceae bacterium TFI 002]